MHSLVDSFRASLRSPFLPCIVHLSLHPSHSATVIGIKRLLVSSVWCRVVCLRRAQNAAGGVAGFSTPYVDTTAAHLAAAQFAAMVSYHKHRNHPVS